MSEFSVFLLLFKTGNRLLISTKYIEKQNRGDNLQRAFLTLVQQTQNTL